MKTRFVTMVAVVVLAAVGPACGPPERPPASDAPATTAPPPPPTTLTPCTPSDREKVEVVARRKDDGCDLTVAPDKVCLKPGGTIEWEVDGRPEKDPDWEACEKNDPNRRVRKVKFRGFRGHDDTRVDLFGEDCKLEMPKPNNRRSLECTLKTDLAEDDYKYSAAGLDQADDDVVENDPTIQVRGGR